MGKGPVYSCNKCGACYSIMFGVGMGYPYEYDKIMKNLFKGKFGNNLQKIVKDTKNVVVDAQNYLYVCEKCDYWNVVNGMDLYEVKNEDLIKEYTNKNQKWIDGYAFFDYNPKDFRILKRVKSACPQCKSRMKKYSEEDDFPILKCPTCHEELTLYGNILWDWWKLYLFLKI